LKLLEIDDTTVKEKRLDLIQEATEIMMILSSILIKSKPKTELEVLTI
jgi:hypothetical protein